MRGAAKGPGGRAASSLARGLRRERSGAAPGRGSQGRRAAGSPPGAVGQPLNLRVKQLAQPQVDSCLSAQEPHQLEPPPGGLGTPWPRLSEAVWTHLSAALRCPSPPSSADGCAAGRAPSDVGGLSAPAAGLSAAEQSSAGARPRGGGGHCLEQPQVPRRRDHKWPLLGVAPSSPA